MVVGGAWVHGQLDLYGEARAEVGQRGCGLQDGGGVHPYSFGDDVVRFGGHGYESLFWLSLCEVGVDVVEDVGRVRAKVAACEGLCLVIRCCGSSGGVDSRGAPACPFCLPRTCCNRWRFLLGQGRARWALW